MNENHNGSPSNDFYNPYEEYIKDRVAQEEIASCGEAYQRCTQEGADTSRDDGRSYLRPAAPLNGLAKAGFALSIVSLLCCSFTGWYIPLGTGIMAIALAVCSRFYNNNARRFHSLAIAAIIISTISILFIALILIFYVVIFPELMNDPTFRDTYNQLLEQLESHMQND